ncbi:MULTISPECIES: hypothetical protein [Acinetobacter]|uniref:hypothetical protein n=1 Tax=Acinetobacter TaxID=469 RepID=UPI000D010AAD|nr:hypothetical protein [Acinetobacter sp. MYb10]QLD61397.1 hypothetical protein CQZ96_009000 [Acinetobacter sp. MYb10]
MKVIYTNTIPENQQLNVCYRTSFLGVISAATSVEVDDEFPNAEAVKQAYAFLNAQALSVQVNVGITPELQAVVDEAKAECRKVVAERDEALDQLQTSKGEFIAFQNNIEAMKARITELEANADKTDEEKPKTTKAK